jgi:hypothetical protein
MNTIKKLLGFLWLVIGPVMLFGLLYRAIHEFKIAKPEQLSELQVFWPVVIIIFIPIAVGFSIFGWYAIKNLYHTLPQNSNEL